MAGEVKTLSHSYRLVIAMYSPHYEVETGLVECPMEKKLQNSL